MRKAELERVRKVVKECIFDSHVLGRKAMAKKEYKIEIMLEDEGEANLLYRRIERIMGDIRSNGLLSMETWECSSSPISSTTISKPSNSSET